MSILLDWAAWVSVCSLISMSVGALSTWVGWNHSNVSRLDRLEEIVTRDDERITHLERKDDEP